MRKRINKIIKGKQRFYPKKVSTRLKKVRKNILQLKGVRKIKNTKKVGKIILLHLFYLLPFKGK